MKKTCQKQACKLVTTVKIAIRIYQDTYNERKCKSTNGEPMGHWAKIATAHNIITKCPKHPPFI